MIYEGDQSLCKVFDTIFEVISSLIYESKEKVSSRKHLIIISEQISVFTNTVT